MSDRSILGIVLVACIGADACAGPREDLLRLVPEDYTFCFVAQDLRRTGGRPDGPGVLPALTQSALFRLLILMPEIEQLSRVLESLRLALDLSPRQVREDLLGDVVVFAYRKGPQGRPEEDDGLLLVHARDAELLSRVVERTNQIQQQNGELRAVESVEGPAGSYRKRVKAVADEPADYYAVVGNRLIFTQRERLLTSLLPELASEATSAPRLVRQMERLGVDSAPLVCLANPRSFDADFTRAARDETPQAAFVREFLKLWRALDELAIAVRWSPTTEVQLALNVRREVLPRHLRTVLTEAALRSPLWDLIPSDAMVAAAGRIPPEALLQLLSSILSDDDRRKFHDALGNALRPFVEQEDVTPLFRGLGPDFGLWIAPPRDTSSERWCPEGVFAMRIVPTADGRRAEDAALKGLDFAARAACLANKDLRIHSTYQGDLLVRSLSHVRGFPKGFQPAFASKQGYLVIADSPETIARFRAPSAGPTAADEIPIARLAVERLRRFWKEHHDPISQLLRAANNPHLAQLDTRLGPILQAIEGVEQIELVQRPRSGGVTFALRFAERLKK